MSYESIISAHSGAISRSLSLFCAQCGNADAPEGTEVPEKGTLHRIWSSQRLRRATRRQKRSESETKDATKTGTAKKEASKAAGARGFRFLFLGLTIHLAALSTRAHCPDCPPVRRTAIGSHHSSRDPSSGEETVSIRFRRSDGDDDDAKNWRHSIIIASVGRV